LVSLVILFTIYQPIGNPNKIPKIGTPIPIAMQNKSRTIKITKTIFRFIWKILGIVLLPE
jgi:hypothetical protein